jgi:hypothetical protein
VFLATGTNRRSDLGQVSIHAEIRESSLIACDDRATFRERDVISVQRTVWLRSQLLEKSGIFPCPAEHLFH